MSTSVALVTQHAMRMRFWLYRIFFSHHLIQARFSEHAIGYKMRVLISLQLLSETFLTLIKTERDVTINVHHSSCKVPAILVRF